MPEISIIVPVYNVEQYLDQCLNSIANQTFRDFEVILVDDGSPDRCPQICDKWGKKDQRFRVFHKENGGLSSARNLGLSVAKGNYVGFVDSDDWIFSEMYEILYHMCVENHADISCCAFTRTPDAGMESGNIKEPVTVFSQEEFAKKFFKIGSNETVHYVWNKLYKRNVAEKISFPETLIDEDVEGFFGALCEAERIAVTSQVLYFYRKNTEGISAKWFSHRQMDLLQIWNNIVSECAQNGKTEWTEYARMNYYRAYFGLLCRLCLNDKSEDSLYEEEETQLRKGLAEYYWKLMKSRMPLSRKAIMTGMRINFGLSRKLIRWAENKHIQS